MQLEARAGTMPSRGHLVFIALLVGSIWTFGGLMPLGAPQADPMTFFDQVRSLTFSAMLAVFALVAWLVVGLARPSRWILAAAAIMGIGGIVAGIGNFAEEMLRIAGAEYLYGLGLFPLMIGMIGTAIALLVRRERVPAILMFLTIGGFVSAMGRGPSLVPLVWFGFAAWVFFRAPSVAGTD